MINHRRVLLSILTLVFAGSLFAKPVTINVTEPGTGESLFQANASATEIVVTGRINHLDLLTLRSSCRSLEVLDLSQVHIEAYSDDVTYDEFAENEFTAALAQSASLREIILPQEVVKIAYRALYGCPKLQCITIPTKVVPNVGKDPFVEKSRLAEIILYVPEEAIEAYKKQKQTIWGFKEILPISKPSPWANLIFDDIYGANYFPLTKGGTNKVFFVAYFNNQTERTVDNIEFSYWYDNSEPKTAVLKDVQLLPGAETPDGAGFITFEIPEDTYPHLFTIQPIRVNGEPVEFSKRARPLRTYYVENTFRQPTHLLEVFVDPEDKSSLEAYANILRCVSRIEGLTSQPDRYEIVTMTASAKEGALVSTFPFVQNIVQTYKFGGLPRIMLNRDLMTPYGSLNNNKELLDLSAYSPGMKIGDLLTVYQYLIERSFHKPGFATLTTRLGRKGNDWICSFTGELSKDENIKGDLRLVAYLVENTPLPKFDKEAQEVEDIPEGKLYRKASATLTPVDGIKITADEKGYFTLATESFKIPDYVSDKYRVVAFLHRTNEPMKCNNGVLQSSSIVVNEANITHVFEVAKQPQEPLLGISLSGLVTSLDLDWTIAGIYAVDGRSFNQHSSLPRGQYVVVLKHISGHTSVVKCVVSK